MTTQKKARSALIGILFLSNMYLMISCTPPPPPEGTWRLIRTDLDNNADGIIDGNLVHNYDDVLRSKSYESDFENDGIPDMVSIAYFDVQGNEIRFEGMLDPVTSSPAFIRYNYYNNKNVLIRLERDNDNSGSIDSVTVWSTNTIIGSDSYSAHIPANSETFSTYSFPGLNNFSYLPVGPEVVVVTSSIVAASKISI